MLRSNMSGMTPSTTLIYAQVAEAAQLESRAHYQPSPSPVNSGTIIDTRDHSGTLPPALNLPWKSIPVPGTGVKTPHDLGSPRPTFSEYQTEVTCLSLLQEEKKCGPYTVGLSGVDMNGMLHNIPSPTATTWDSSINSSPRDSLNSTPSPPPTPKIKLNIKSQPKGMWVDTTKIKAVPILSEEEQRIRNEKDAKRLQKKILEEQMREAEYLRLAKEEEKRQQLEAEQEEKENERRWQLEEAEDEENLHLEDQEGDDVITPPPEMTPYVFEHSPPKGAYDLCYPVQEVIRAVRDNYPRKTDPSDLNWLSQMYGAPVHCSRLSEDQFDDKFHIYITGYGRIVENLPCFRALVIYLHPIPRRNCDVFRHVTNSVYVIEEEVTHLCPPQVVIPRPIVTASYEQLQLEIIITQSNPNHRYGLPMQLSIVVGKKVLYICDQILCRDLVCKVDSKYNGAIVPDTEPGLVPEGLWNERMTQLRRDRVQSVPEEKKAQPLPEERKVQPLPPVQNTTVLSEAAVREREIAYRRERDRSHLKDNDDTKSQTSSVGSTGSRVTVKPHEESSIKGWAEDQYNIDEDSKAVTDIKILYENYKTHAKLSAMPLRRFTDCMKNIYPHLWKQTTNIERKRITGYRGFNLKQ
jgi:hypothetical protein